MRAPNLADEVGEVISAGVGVGLRYQVGCWEKEWERGDEAGSLYLEIWAHHTRRRYWQCINLQDSDERRSSVQTRPHRLLLTVGEWTVVQVR